MYKSFHLWVNCPFKMGCGISEFQRENGKELRLSLKKAKKHTQLQLTTKPERLSQHRHNKRDLSNRKPASVHKGDTMWEDTG